METVTIPQSRFVKMHFNDYETLLKMVLTNDQVDALTALIEDLEGELTSVEQAALRRLQRMTEIDITEVVQKVETIMALMREKHERVQGLLETQRRDAHIRQTRMLRRRSVGGNR